MQNKKSLIAVLAAVITSMTFMNTGNILPATAQETQGTVVRDSVLLLLSGQTIPGESFIHLYDSAPYNIVNGHVAAKIPCDDDSNSTLQILTGSAPDFQPAELELIQNSSTPGELCLYHADLPQAGVNVTTDLAIQNPTDSAVDFPETSTVVVGINEIMPGTEEHADTEEHG